MKRWLISAICLFLFSFYGISAQEEESQTEAEGTEWQGQDEPDVEVQEEAAETSAETSYIEMDIRTSSLVELAAWCRELGLSDGGGREELASRLRSYYGITSGRTAQADQRVITIESAKTTEYFTLAEVDEEYARLKGDVVVSLRDGNAVHRIKAAEILYNRTRNVMTASGKVEYVKEEGDSRETFKGDSITVNLDNWSSIFMDGASEKSRAGTGAAYRFSGTVISRNDEDVTVLTGAEITNAETEEPYWSLYASKLWLLPGNDWAILNAVLKIGNIPVLYLPAFYYPADEIVFHPVLGVRNREGTFLNTTTYLIGQPKADSLVENSLTKIFGSASDEAGRTVEGVFIRRTGERKTDPSGILLKLLLDAYTKMGFYLGTELELPRKGMMGEFKLDAGIGLTRNVYDGGGWYTPFVDGKSVWNMDSDFFGLTSPLRFRFKTTGSMQFQYGSFRWDFPFYSDPYVDRDFMRNRSELLDWFTMIRDMGSGEDTTIIDPLSSYEWRLTGSLNPRVSLLSPYINSFSIRTISSSLSFGTRDSPKYRNQPPERLPLVANPGRSFFHPNMLTIASLSAGISGAPLTLGTSANRPARVIEPAPGDSLLPDLPLSPWDIPADEGAGMAAADGLLDDYEFTIPVLAQRFDLARSGNTTFTVNYSLSPEAGSELKFDSARWIEQENIDWSEWSSILTKVSSSGNIGFGLRHSADLYSASLGVSGNAALWRYSLNEDATEYTTPNEVNRKRAHDQAERETLFASRWSLAGSVRPFIQNAVFRDTRFDYSLNGRLANNTVETLGGPRKWATGNWDKPFWDWDKENITTHSLSTSINANVMDYRQVLSFSAVLPPLDSSITANATFRAWISETSVRSQIQNIWSWEDGNVVIRPITINQTFRFSTWGSLGAYLEIDPDPNSARKESDRFTRTTVDLTLWGFTARFMASYGRVFKLNQDFFGGVGQLWKQGEEEEFAARELNFAYNKRFEKNGLWKNRFSFGVTASSSLAFDLQRYTNSNLNFRISFDMKVTNFISIQLSTRSENSVIYRYKIFQGMYSLFGKDTPRGLYPDQESSFFLDLAKSFNFFNEDDRRKSGFKLKDMDVTLTHHMGDWNAQLSVVMKPYINLNTYKYEFRNEITFWVRWVPIQEMRIETTHREGRLEVK